MNRSVTTSSVAPYLFYRDVGAAAEWLACAFGFRELARAPAGCAPTSAELAAGPDRIVLAQAPPGACTGGTPAAAIHVTVSDLARHFLRAREALADVVFPPQDAPFGLREYCVTDLEGHCWIFAEQMRDVDPEEWDGWRAYPVRSLLSVPDDAYVT